MYKINYTGKELLEDMQSIIDSYPNFYKKKFTEYLDKYERPVNFECYINVRNGALEDMIENYRRD